MKEAARREHKELPYDMLPIRAVKNNRATSISINKLLGNSSKIIYSSIRFHLVTLTEGDRVLDPPCKSQAPNLLNLRINNRYWQVRRHGLRHRKGSIFLLIRYSPTVNSPSTSTAPVMTTERQAIILLSHCSKFKKLHVPPARQPHGPRCLQPQHSHTKVPLGG